MRRISFILCCAVLACARPHSGSVATAPATTPKEIAWTRGSAEHRALFLQVYRAAEAELARRAPGMQAGTWAVVLDADETVLDNSLYQLERARIGAGYSSDSWAAWVRRKEATALPGAISFTRKVHQLGGRVVIVTNRTEDVCAETRDNLRQVDLQADMVLCAPPNQSDKNIRFRAVESGTASPAAAALRIVMYVGDNIQDFPNLGQDVRLAGDTAFAEFGKTYFLLPNPMYGSWERNPVP